MNGESCLFKGFYYLMHIGFCIVKGNTSGRGLPVNFDVHHPVDSFKDRTYPRYDSWSGTTRRDLEDSGFFLSYSQVGGTDQQQ